MTDDPLLQVGHVLQRALDAQVATGHHDRVGLVGDLDQGLHGAERLDLGDEAHGHRGDGRAHLLQVGRSTHERHGEEVDAVADHHLGHLQVLVGRRREPQPVTRQVDARAALGLPAGEHDGGDRIGRRSSRPTARSPRRRPPPGRRARGRGAASGTRRRSRRTSWRRGAASAGTRRTVVPAASTVTPSGNEAARTFGPGRSASTATTEPVRAGGLAHGAAACRCGSATCRG